MATTERRPMRAPAPFRRRRWPSAATTREATSITAAISTHRQRRCRAASMEAGNAVRSTTERKTKHTATPATTSQTALLRLRVWPGTRVFMSRGYGQSCEELSVERLLGLVLLRVLGNALAP